MKVKLLTALSGSDGSWVAGDQIECDKEQAERYFDAGIAEPVEAQKKPQNKQKSKK